MAVGEDEKKSEKLSHGFMSLKRSGGRRRRHRRGQ